MWFGGLEYLLLCSLFHSEIHFQFTQRCRWKTDSSGSEGKWENERIRVWRDEQATEAGVLLLLLKRIARQSACISQFGTTMLSQIHCGASQRLSLAQCLKEKKSICVCVCVCICIYTHTCTQKGCNEDTVIVEQTFLEKHVFSSIFKLSGGGGGGAGGGVASKCYASCYPQPRVFIFGKFRKFYPHFSFFEWHK